MTPGKEVSIETELAVDVAAELEASDSHQAVVIVATLKYVAVKVARPLSVPIRRHGLSLLSRHTASHTTTTVFLVPPSFMIAVAVESESW